MAGRGAFLFWLFLILAVAPSRATAEEPWRLQSALDLPDWLRVSGETRLRYEALDGQFRAGRTGGDQGFFIRSLLLTEADTGAVTFGVELQDSRAYLTDSGTPLTTSLVNPLDVLQAYARVKAPGLLGAGSRTDLILGRQTVNIGSRRQIARFGYANVIRNFTGAHAVSKNDRGDELHIVLVSPLGRAPTLRSELDNNVLRFDREQFGRRVWGLHYRRADIALLSAPDLWGELFVYGLNEEDTDRVATPNRQYVTPGFRLFRKPKAGRWDIDLEGALRLGTRRATSDAGDTQDLKVRASSLMARAGYTFDAPWRPRVALQYFWASGDEDPDDDRFDQYERLFAARRTDLNHTGLHGPLTFTNLSAPGVRLDVKPTARTDARLHYSAAFLASDTDTFTVSRLRDASGQSGDFAGHAIDMRARARVLPGNLVLEVGASAFVFGEFTKATRADPRVNRTLYAYLQATASF
ncbi:MAG: alginate export family protein [Pseudomonadota bacterium]